MQSTHALFTLLSPSVTFMSVYCSFKFTVTVTNLLQSDSIYYFTFCTESFKRKLVRKKSINLNIHFV